MPLHRGKTFGIHIFCSNWLCHQRQQTFEAPHPYEGAERYDDLTNFLPGCETRHILLVVNVDIHHTKERQQETKLPYFLKKIGKKNKNWTRINSTPLQSRKIILSCTRAWCQPQRSVSVPNGVVRQYKCNRVETLRRGKFSPHHRSKRKYT